MNSDIGLIDGMSYTQNVWVGGRNIDIEDAWYWSDGEPWFDGIIWGDGKLIMS